MEKITLHKEGKTSLLLAFSFFVGANTLTYLTASNLLLKALVFVISFIFFLIILQFFRKPIFETLQDENVIYAPADGKVVVVEEVLEKEFFNEKKIQISIFMSPFNVHSNKSPITGTIEKVNYHKGKYLMAWEPKSSTDNERNAVLFSNEKGKIACTQIAGFLARRICSYAQKGAKIKQGEEFGFIKFGSRVDVFLPLGTKIEVVLDQKTKAGKTVIAKW